MLDVVKTMESGANRVSAVFAGAVVLGVIKWTARVFKETTFEPVEKLGKEAERKRFTGEKTGCLY